MVGSICHHLPLSSHHHQHHYHLSPVALLPLRPAFVASRTRRFRTSFVYTLFLSSFDPVVNELDQSHQDSRYFTIQNLPFDF